MADAGVGFLQGIEAFANTRLGGLAGTTFSDTGSFLESIVTFDGFEEISDDFDQLKSDIDQMKPIVEAIAKKIDKHTKIIAKMVTESADDIDSDDFDVDVAARVAVRIGTALAAMDAAYLIVATELARNDAGVVDSTLRDGLMGLWDPWTKPFKDLGTGSENALNSFGELLGIDNLVDELGEFLTLDRSGGTFLLAAKIFKPDKVELGALSLDQVAFEAFLQFSDRQIANPTEAEKAGLVERDGKFYLGDVAIVGLRLRTLLEPGITDNALLAKIMPGSKDPKTTSHTAISLDSGQGFYLGDGRGNEKAVLPIRYSFPGVELREMALGLRRNDEREVTGFEVTTSIAATFGDVMGAQVVGSGVIISLDGEIEHEAIFPMVVSPRWPDQVGLRVKAGPIQGGGFIQRVERKYKVDGKEVSLVEFGGVLQLKILNLGVSAIVILAPDPFSLVMVIGVRFPTPIDLSMGFTLNGVGGILAIDRGLALDALKQGVKDHVLDKMLFPDDPVAAAPDLLDKVAHIFPPRDGGFVVGPIVELGWGSQAKFVEMKLGVVLALPDPMVVILGSMRIRVPTKEAPITDIKADVFAAVTPEYFLLFAAMRDSKIAKIKVSGDLGLYIQWSGGGAFELSIGGFHPEYEKLTGAKPKLGELERVTIDLSPSKQVKFVIKAYFAITAGSVMLGVEGRLKADFAVIVIEAWLILDMIFIWSPRFAFKVSLEVGVDVELLGFSFCSIMFRGSIEGTTPWRLAGHVKVDVWFLPTFDEELGPIEWGEQPKPIGPEVDALAVAAKALNEEDAWRVELPTHAAQLAIVDEVDVDGRIAHPLAALQASQTQVPFGVRLTHIGSSPVKADMITIGTPESTNAELVGAVSEVHTAFSPGHYFDLEGEKLLARSGFEDMVGGCRMAAATTPKVGPSVDGQVEYHTYVRNPHERSELIDFDLPIAMPGWEYAERTVVGRAAAEGDATNPYLPPARVHAEGAVAVAPAGTSTVADATSGASIAVGLDQMTVTEAALVTQALVSQGVADAVRVTVD